jgi:hypothetical protein
MRKVDGKARRKTQRKTKPKDLDARQSNAIKGGLAQLRGMSPTNATVQSSTTSTTSG